MMVLMSKYISDESSLLVRYSYKNKPWELYVASNKTYTSLDQITSSLTKVLKPILGVNEVITFKAQDGTTVH
jgi:dipeptidyl aminopeptidase/acylaminoacyl peptidase